MKRSKKRTLFLSALAALTALNGIISWNTLSEVDQLKQRLSDINYFQSHLSDQISGISSQVRSTLEQQASIFSEVRCEPDSFDRESRMVRFLLSAVPRTFVEGSSLTIQYRVDGGELQSQQAGYSGNSRFEAQLLLPLSVESVTLDASLTLPDGTVRNQQLEPIYGTYDAFRIDAFYPSFGGGASFADGQIRLDGEIRFLQDDTGKQGGNHLVSAQLMVQRNGETLETLPFTASGETSPQEYLCPLNHSYPAADGDAVSIAVELEDSNGVRYRSVVMTFDILDGRVDYVDEWGAFEIC